MDIRHGLLYYVMSLLPPAATFIHPCRLVMSKSSTTKGILLAVLSCLLWGSVFIFARYLLGTPRRIDPYLLVFLRYSLSASMLFAYAKYKRLPFMPKSRQQLIGMLKTGFFLYWLMSLCFFIGQRNVTAMTASLFIESGPAIILIAWKIISRQKTTNVEYVACALGLLGSMLVLNIISPSGIHLTGNPFGILFVFLSAVSWVIGGYCGKDLMQKGERIIGIAWSILFCAIFDIPVVLLMRHQIIFPSTPSAWAAILSMAIFPTSIAFVAWGEAMAILPLWQLNLTQNLTPVFTLIGSYFILHEPLTIWNLVGIAIVLAGLSAAALKSQKT